MVLTALRISSSLGSVLDPTPNSWLTTSISLVCEREMYAFSNGERALRRAASYVELGRVWFEREKKRGKELSGRWLYALCQYWLPIIIVDLRRHHFVSLSKIQTFSERNEGIPITSLLHVPALYVQPCAHYLWVTGWNVHCQQN